MRYECKMCRHKYSSMQKYAVRCPACKSTHVVKTDEPITHSNGGGTQSSHSWLNTQETLYISSSEPSTESPSFSSGGGDSGGGGASGDW